MCPPSANLVCRLDISAQLCQPPPPQASLSCGLRKQGFNRVRTQKLRWGPLYVFVQPCRPLSIVPLGDLEGTQGGLESQAESTIIPDVRPGATSSRTMVCPLPCSFCLLLACSVPRGSSAWWLLLECVGKRGAAVVGCLSGCCDGHVASAE